ncbi:hypothetical protein A3H53_01490 [Candidatus Nomurabacteria bacterium RIFCSPLOWO2_02_FULL_40_10]|uniref:Uncharacterized protein n=1 Tax=Candidatus Nomurabacteria bacterium RIFCSPLOWO2_02_FULL_40_10 TaxID=1801786 RepID=A0A1F6XZ70_9BACT|nr:MAG: hypothetical protein A3H53_01490 [Candidatus Nomurabacteria bacterium RIFCSPLOWO2_02_FULL_40_10]
MRSNIFNRLSFVSLFLVMVLLPFFLLPFTNIPIGISKGVLLATGLAFSVIFWGFARFFDGKIILPRSLPLFGGGLIVLVVFLSAIFVKDSEVSFFGTMFDIGSFWFIFSGFLFMLMCALVFRDQKSARVVLFGVILSSIVVLIFQTVHMFFPGELSLGVLDPALKTDNVIGSWNELGLFAGFSALMSLLMVEFFLMTRLEKWILRALIILSVFLIAAINFSLVWELLGVSALIIFVYKISISFKEKIAEDAGSATSVKKEKTHFPVFSFVIIMIALLFFMSGQFVGGIISSRLGVQNTEINITLRTTTEVARAVLKDNFLFGIGPNKFGEAWAMYKPVTVNAPINGNLWNLPVSSGSGLLPTIISTTGYAGILAWLLFFGLFIFSGVKSIFSSIKNRVNWETMAFFVLSLYLFVSSFFYPAGSVTFLLALAFAGVFAGLSAGNNAGGDISLSFLSDHRKSFFSILFIVLAIVLSSAALFTYAGRLASVSYFREALTVPTVPEAVVAINKALSLYQNDLYLRAYAQIYLVKLNSLAQKKEGELSDADKKDLQTSLDQAVIGAKSAVAYNPKNYINLQALGSLYENLAAIGVKDAYLGAAEAYKGAATLNPNNPGIKLSLAIASNALKKADEAESYAKEALALKPDYVDGWIVLSKLAKSAGNNADALSYAKTALSISPLDENLKKYVDLLKNGSSSNVAVPPTSSTLPSDSTPKIKDSSVKNKQ